MKDGSTGVILTSHVAMFSPQWRVRHQHKIKQKALQNDIDDWIASSSIANGSRKCLWSFVYLWKPDMCIFQKRHRTCISSLSNINSHRKLPNPVWERSVCAKCIENFGYHNKSSTICGQKNTRELDNTWLYQAAANCSQHSGLKSCHIRIPFIIFGVFSHLLKKCIAFCSRMQPAW